MRRGGEGVVRGVGEGEGEMRGRGMAKGKKGRRIVKGYLLLLFYLLEQLSWRVLELYFSMKIQHF